MTLPQNSLKHVVLFVNNRVKHNVVLNCVPVLPVFYLRITLHPHLTNFLVFIMDVQHNPQACGTDVFYNGFTLEKHVSGLQDYRLSRFFTIFLRVESNQVWRDVFVVLSRCFYNYEASFVVVTIYKVRESWVKKKIGFHICLKQIWKFFKLPFFIWLPFDLVALGGLASIVNAKDVVLDNNHEFTGVLTENQLESPIHLSF